MCGIIGIMSNGPVAADIYSGLIAIQHRGQDSAGIGTYDQLFKIHKGNGLVTQLFNEQIIAKLTGSMGIGQVRYPTIGGGLPQDAQPLIVNSPYGIAIVHNGNVTNYDELKEELFEKDLRLLESHNDVEVILNVFAEELQKQRLNGLTPEKVFTAVNGVFSRVKGAYVCIAIIAGKGMVAFRDPYGIRPLVMGKRGKDFAFASETVAFDYSGFHTDRDVQPGEAIYIDMNGTVHTKIVKQKEHRPCIFEYVYFARPDSLLDDISVYKSRLRMGKELARLWKEKGWEADVVIPIPESSRAAALAFAEETGMRYREGFIKNRYVGRTFIMPSQKQRDRSVRDKLNPIELEIRDKRIVIIDDSIVRGTTSRKIVELLRSVGAKAVYFLVSSPPVISPCLYGIDIQTRDELVAREKSVDEIQKMIGADGLIYQTINGLVRACSEGNPKITKFCSACFDGEYPTGDVTEEMMKRIEDERRCRHS